MQKCWKMMLFLCSFSPPQSFWSAPLHCSLYCLFHLRLVTITGISVWPCVVALIPYEREQGSVNSEKRAGTAALSLCLLQFRQQQQKTVFFVSLSCQILGAPVSEYVHVFKEASYSVTINNIKNNGYSSLNIYHGLSTVLAPSQKSTYIIQSRYYYLLSYRWGNRRSEKLSKASKLQSQ